MFHSIVTNFTWLHCIICQTVENTSFLERFHVEYVCKRLPRLQIQVRISHSFRSQNRANVGSKYVVGFAERNTPLVFVKWGDNIWEFVTRVTEKCLLSILTSVHIKEVHPTEKDISFSFGTNEIVHYIRVCVWSLWIGILINLSMVKVAALALKYFALPKQGRNLT